MMRAALIAAALLAACSPPASDTPGSITAEWKDPFDTGPVVQLPYGDDGVRIDVAVGQLMEYEGWSSPATGDTDEPLQLPPFVEYLGIRGAPTNESPEERRRVGGDRKHIHTFVARAPGEGVLSIRSYSQREPNDPGYVVVRVIVVARAS